MVTGLKSSEWEMRDGRDVRDVEMVEMGSGHAIYLKLLKNNRKNTLIEMGGDGVGDGEMRDGVGPR